jgi:hypothetical protein
MKKRCFKSRSINLPRSLLLAVQAEALEIPEEFYSDRLKVTPTADSEAPTFPPEHLNELRSLRSFFEATVHEFGTVFVKLGDKAALDMHGWTPELQCRHFEDLLMTIKYSQILNDVVAGSTSPSLPLTLRKWYPLNPSMEFRCVWRQKTLIAVIQRNIDVYYPFLAELGLQTIIPKVNEFCRESLEGEADLIVDVYINAPPTYKVSLVSIEPFSEDKIPSQFLSALSQEKGPGHPTFLSLASEEEAEKKVFGNDFPLVHSIGVHGRHLPTGPGTPVLFRPVGFVQWPIMLYESQYNQQQHSRPHKPCRLRVLEGWQVPLHGVLQSCNRLAKDAEVIHKAFTGLVEAFELAGDLSEHSDVDVLEGKDERRIGLGTGVVQELAELEDEGSEESEDVDDLH